MLVTHLDTVYPAEEEIRNSFSWVAESGRIYGPGVNDNKGGTAMIWLVLAALRDIAPDVFEGISWLIAANAAEEELVPDFPESCRIRMPRNCRAALIFEACGGSGRGLTLVRSRKGSANLRVAVEGRGAHAGSNHHQGANAIVEMARLVDLALLAEPRGGLSDGNYLSELVPTLDGLGPFGLNGHASERSADGSKLPEFVVLSSFLEMGAITIAAIRELVSE